MILGAVLVVYSSVVLALGVLLPFAGGISEEQGSALLLADVAYAEENLQRLDDDLDILKAYLKTQRAPKAAIEAHEGLTIEQHVSWKKAVERIERTLREWAGGKG